VRGPAARRPPETAAKIIVSGSIPAFAAVFFPGTGKCTGTCGRRPGNGGGEKSAAKEESVADAGTVVGTESTTGTVRAEKKSVIDTFFDINYPDERIEKVWPNMKVEVQ